MIEIDGSYKSGSGTILRYSVALSALLKEPLFIYNIRAKRTKPGLRPQHLKSVEATKQLTEAEVDNLQVGQQKLNFKATSSVKGGSYYFDIGTAGSTTMLLLTIIPLLCFSDKKTIVRIEGGLFQDNAPSAFHMQNVLFNILARMGINIKLRIIRPGYVPKGGGIIEAEVEPVNDKIKPIKLLKQGSINEIKGISCASHLKKQKVAERMKEAANKLINKKGYNAEIDIINDTTSIQEGAALFINAKTTTGCIIGMDQAGKPGRRSEKIGNYVAYNLFKDIESGATTDRFLSDQLIIFCALADGVSEYIIPFITEHIDTNLWLVEKILGAKVELKDRHLRIEGIGYKNIKTKNCRW